MLTCWMDCISVMDLVGLAHISACSGIWQWDGGFDWNNFELCAVWEWLNWVVGDH